MKIRKMSLTVGLLVAALVASASLAWACTPGSILDPITPSGGAARGADMMIAGRNFHSGPVPVEIRWDSLEGPVIGTASGPAFTATAKVPSDASLGVHYVVAIQKDQTGTVVAKMTETFEVTKGAAVSNRPSAASVAGVKQVPSDLWSGFQKGNAGVDGRAAAASADHGLQKNLAAGAGSAAVMLSLFSLASLVVIRRRRSSKASANRP